LQAERALIALHSGAVLLSLTAALMWPRTGQAALLVPLGEQKMESALDWVAREDAELIELDSTSGRIVARISDNRSAWRAIAAGFVPIAARAGGCTSDAKGIGPW
jgi:hypothetical protein